jgi:hypothetical protein
VRGSACWFFGEPSGVFSLPSAHRISYSAVRLGIRQTASAKSRDRTVRRSIQRTARATKFVRRGSPDPAALPADGLQPGVRSFSTPYPGGPVPTVRLPPTPSCGSWSDRSPAESPVNPCGRERWMVKDILGRLEPRPAKRTLQDDRSVLQSFGLVEVIGRSAGARWALRHGQQSCGNNAE